ncbi:MAG: phosphodiester glycosidase family protein [Clostridia bacterium]|nr:phosphodiester glycosidase family protein [Clostridia bacterium]
MKNANNPKKSKHKVLRIVFRAIVFILVLAIYVGASAYGVCAVVFWGPSPSFRNSLVATAMETSVGRILPRLYFSSAEIDKLVEETKVREIDPDQDVDVSQIVINPITDSADDDEWADHPDGIRIEHVKGATYNGYMMIIRDPSRVYVATSSNFKNGQAGKKIMDVYEREGAVAAINGGGFPDANGNGNGDVPTGLTFSKGVKVWGSDYTSDSGVVGFDTDNKLIVGTFSAAKAYKKNIRDCVAFGPILVMNGEPMTTSGSGGSLNPRTGIGQRADGAVLFLVIEGRIPTSLGATYRDMIELFVRFGAVNACNLDGGSSTSLIYNGEHINQSASLYGPRRLPTFFMVRPLEE